jgi:hypothetical protein
MAEAAKSLGLSGQARPAALSKILVFERRRCRSNVTHNLMDYL